MIHADAFKSIKLFSEEAKPFDIVFLDPPYAQKLAKKTLKLLGARDILHAQSLVCVQLEASEKLEIPEGLALLTQRRYGSSYLTVLQKVAI